MKIEVKDFDIRHYSALIRNSAAYKKLKNVMIFTGIVFLVVALSIVLNTFATHSANGVMITCLSVIFAMFIALGIRMRQLDPVKGFKKFRTKNPNYNIKVSFGDEEITLDTADKLLQYKNSVLLFMSSKDIYFLEEKYKNLANKK
ncbi:MAG: hypothetical protein IK072_05275 [Clostridia bacterium]|nr:hypothetical protein [Clostridia bacterium]